MRIDLKALLLISTSSSPDNVIRLNKRFQVGKSNYMMRYELQKGDLIIRQLKRVRVNSNLGSRSKKRQRRQKRKLEIRSTSVESGSQTSLHHNSIAVGTEVLLTNTASETAHQECSSIQVDTSDLTLTYSRFQQTRSSEFQSSCSQTESLHSLSRTTQARIAAKSWSTQTGLRIASLASQTETLCTNTCVQYEMDGQHEITQTDGVEEQLIKPYMQELIQESTKNIGHIIHNEVRAAFSQVLEVGQLEIKACQEQDLPREGALEPLSPLPVDQIGDKLSAEKYLTLKEIKDILTKSAPKTRVKAKKFSAGYSWNCTMKCKSCGLHMHRSRLRLPVDCQSTQTEGVEREVNKELKKTKVSAEMATQTEKERGRWTLRRS